MKRLLVLGLMVGMAGSVAAPVWAQEPGQVEAARHADTDWLGLVDAGDYAGSWKAASEVIRSILPEDRWESTMKGIRTPLGKVGSRKLRDAQYTTSLPGMPDGEYVVAIYETNFEHKQAGQETVTAVLEKDKTWRVAGYVIK